MRGKLNNQQYMQNYTRAPNEQSWPSSKLNYVAV